ncbi:MAG TPA: hypothetical protein EYO89_00395 [Candidatus Dadabacteria bacterium]|nr:hypothetical protein [Candidatus Dadabacteria bacterium]
MSILLLINEAPSSSKTWNALRLATALIGQDQKPIIFLMNDGVFNVMKNQKPPDEIKGQSTSIKIKELVDIGAKAYYCSQCLETRGINKNLIISEISKSNLLELASIIKETSKIISM